MKIKQSLLLISSIIFTLTGCNADENNYTSGWGKAQFSTVATDDAILISKGSLGLTNLPAPESFSLLVTGPDNYTKNWATIAEYDPETLYKGEETHSATVSYGDLNLEDFDKPCFIGKQNFSVKNEQTAQVAITATIANAIVMIETTDAFKNYFPNYSFTLTTAANKSIAFSKSETRKAYIKPTNFTIQGTAFTQTGAEKTIASKSFSNISAKTLHKITYDVNNGNVGGASLTISFNDDIVATEPLDIELNPQN